MAQSISQEAIGATGLPGATAASRHAGATASGAPTTGTFAVGDYVVDQTGAMWVCTVAGTPGTWQLSGVSVNENIAGKNFIINGGMDIWQRGTSFALSSSLAYSADRWCSYSSSAITVSQQTSGLTGFQYALRMQRNSGSTTTSYSQILYNAESKNSYPLAGQTVTLSFWARAGANFSGASNNINVGVESGTGTDQNQYYGYFTGATLPVNTTATLTTSWQRFTYTCAIPSNSTQFAVFFNYVPTGTAGANDYFDITGVQLEIAPQATPFSRAGGSIGGELSLCQRYYYVITQSPINGGNVAPIGTGSCRSSTTGDVVVNFPVTMRQSPTILTYSTLTVVPGAFNNTAQAVSSILPNTAGISPTTAMVYAVFAGSGTSNGPMYLNLGGSSSSFLGFSAEL